MGVWSSFAQEVLIKGVQDYLMSATAKFESKDYPGAYAELEKVSRLDPDNAAAAYLAARIEIKRENLDAGMRQIEKALKINPEFANAYFWRGYVHELKGSHDAAIADYTRSIQLDWRSEIAYLSRALLRMEKGESQGVVEDLSRVLDLNPKNASAYLARGGIYLDSGKTSAALADYSRAIELNSKEPASYEGRASLYVRSGAYEAALADYARFIELAKDDTAYARFFHFLLCRRLARAEPADFSETVRGWAEGWQKAIGLFLVNEVDEAALLTRAAVGDDKAVRGQRCEAFYYAGMTRLLKGDVAGAREMFQKCVGMGATTFTEYDFAKAELARMDAAAK